MTEKTKAIAKIKQKVSDKTKSRLGISGGVQVAGVKAGKFKEAGITDGFIILTINPSPATTDTRV